MGRKYPRASTKSPIFPVFSKNTELVQRFPKSMAIDLAPYDVRVLTLHPGWVRTDMTSHNGLISIDESVGGMVGVIANIVHYGPGTLRV